MLVILAVSQKNEIEKWPLSISVQNISLVLFVEFCCFDSLDS